MVFITLAESFGHDPARATFDLFLSPEKTVLRAEYSWAVRNALVKAYPFLEDAKATSEDFRSCMLEYINGHVIIGADGSLISMTSIYQVPGEHSHSYIFVGEGPAIEPGFDELTVENRSLFEIYRKQVNTWNIHLGNETKHCYAVMSNPVCTIFLDEAIS